MLNLRLYAQIQALITLISIQYTIIHILTANVVAKQLLKL